MPRRDHATRRERRRGVPWRGVGRRGFAPGWSGL